MEKLSLLLETEKNKIEKELKTRSNEFLSSIRRFLFVSAIYSLSTKELLLQALALIPPHQPVPITPTFICFIN